MKYSILIAVYNKEKYLDKCLDSILNQTYKNYEVIVCDDGSTDNSYNLLKKYNIKLYKKKNSGVSDTRNFLISKVRTKYFLFVDADDYISKDLLKTIDKYDNKNYDILSFSGKEIDENGKILDILNKGKFSCNGEKAIKKLIYNKAYFDVPWGYCYNTNYFKSLHLSYPKGRVHEDFYLTPLVITNAKKIIGIQKYLYYYVQSKQSIVRGNNKAMLNKRKADMLFNYKLLCDTVKNSNFSRKTKEDLYVFALRTALYFCKSLKLKDKLSFLKEINKSENAKHFRFPNDGRVKKFLLNINLSSYLIIGIPYYNLKEKIKRVIKK